MHLLTTVAWYSTWSSIVSDLHNHTNAARRPQRAMQTILCSLRSHLHVLTCFPLTGGCSEGLDAFRFFLKHLFCTENVTAVVRRTLQRLQICSRDRIASSTSSNPQNECHLFYILDFLLAASICCHRGRRRCNTVIHACLQPTRGLCLKAYLNFCVRPFGERLRIANNYFSHHFSSVFSKFSDQLLHRKRFLRKKGSENVFLCPIAYRVCGYYQKEKFFDHFFF